jgi:hypothetical protein
MVYLTTKKLKFPRGGSSQRQPQAMEEPESVGHEAGRKPGGLSQ